MDKRNTIIVSEIGINHNGALNIVKQLIDVAKDVGCNYIKFQKRDIESCYTKEFLDSPRESPWGNTQREQKAGIEFNLEQYQEIDKYCKDKNIGWFCSPWDIKSIDFLKDNFPNMPFLKIPSAKITDIEYLKKCRESGFDLIMSTGMSNYDIIFNALNVFNYYGQKYNKQIKWLLGCTSSYPCPNKDINLKQIQWLRHYFGHDTNIGYSDHSGGILFPAVAVALGAEMIEIHITLDRKMYGSDQASSIEPGGLRHLVKYIEAIEEGVGSLCKDIMPTEIPIINKLRN